MSMLAAFLRGSIQLPCQHVHRGIVRGRWFNAQSYAHQHN